MTAIEVSTSLVLFLFSDIGKAKIVTIKYALFLVSLLILIIRYLMNDILGLLILFYLLFNITISLAC